MGLIAVVCSILSVLQYRWTGELSRAERARLRSGLNEQVVRLSRAFDDQLRESCRSLLPDPADIRDMGRVEAHEARYEQWATSNDPSLFARIGIAVPEQGLLKLYAVERDGRAVPADWPSDWNTLREAMTARARGDGPAPSVPLDSTLIELPVFDNTSAPGGRGKELEWMIFEISTDHLRTKALPHLVAEYLDFGSDAAYDVSVGWADPRRPVIFSTRADGSSVTPGADLTTGLFSSNTGGPPGGSRRRSREEEPRSRWIVSVRHRDGSLDAAVSRARTRNLVTSLALISLLAGAAWALVRYTARSRRLAEMQFRFAVGVSHDLRTPLTAIRGAAFNIADGVVTEPAAITRYASLILRNAEELTSMIENVLAFSASMHHSTGERCEPFAVGDLLEHAAAAVAPEIEQAGCRIEVTVAPELPALTGDPLALEHAFRNLIANAARHATQGRWIGVSAAHCNDGVEIRVSDRGPGIAESERERIFEPFYRGEQTRAAQVRGTGLGLSLVKDTVERHRGTVRVENSPAGGAQFAIWLPALPEIV